MKGEATSQEATAGGQPQWQWQKVLDIYCFFWSSPEVEKEERRRRGKEGDSPLAFTLISNSVP